MGLVMDMDRLRLESLGIALRMVCTEEEMKTGEQGGADVCLGSATIAAIDRVKRRLFEYYLIGHRVFLLLVSLLVHNPTVSTSSDADSIPSQSIEI